MAAVTDDRRALSPEEVFEAVRDKVPGMAARLLRGKPPRVQCHLDDLIQVGLIELWKVANRPDGFDPAKGTPLAFAGRRVMGAMVDWIRDQRGIHGRRYRQAAVAVARGEVVPEVVELSRLTYRDRHGTTKRGFDGWHWPAVEPPEVADDAAAEVAALIRRTGATLPGVERAALIEYVTTGATLKELGRRRGVNESRMQQIVKKAASRVRAAMAAKGLTGFYA